MGGTRWRLQLRRGALLGGLEKTFSSMAVRQTSEGRLLRHHTEPPWILYMIMRQKHTQGTHRQLWIARIGLILDLLLLPIVIRFSCIVRWRFRTLNIRLIRLGSLSWTRTKSQYRPGLKFFQRSGTLLIVMQRSQNTSRRATLLR